MSDLTVSIELSPDMYVVLTSLRGFYNMDEGQVIEIALEHLTADVKLIMQTIKAEREARKGGD